MSAISIPPWQEFIGSDGLWSPIPISVGQQQSQLLLLPATSQTAIWALLPDACSGSGAPTNCTELRGGTWNFRASTSYSPKMPGQPGHPFSLPYFAEQPFATTLPTNLTYSINTSTPAVAGLDTVGLGYQGTLDPLNQQLVLSYSGPSPYVGQFGLLPYYTDLGSGVGKYNNSLAAYNYTRTVKSASYGYNAGAYYRNAWASLTFGGYDAKRGSVDNAKSLEVPMNEQTFGDLVVWVNDIALSADGNIRHANGTGHPWFIDSMLPELWLPQLTCQSFEDAFGLVYNYTSEMYFIDTALHDSLVKRNASVTITLSANSTSSQSLSIFFPFAAFNQTASWPIIGGANYTSETLQYFPLKRANDSTQYVLGRTFLQEAYLAADYNPYNRRFFLSQATFDPAHDTDIRDWPVSSSASLSRGAVAGIAVGAVAAVALILGVAFFFWKRRKYQRKRKEYEAASVRARASSMGGTTINDEVMSMRNREEFYKPPAIAEVADENSDQFKAELDARFTARGYNTERHELDAGMVSRSSIGVSPLRPNHHRLPSDPSSMGAPSPMMSGHPSPPIGSAEDSPFGGTPAAVPDGRQWFGGGPFELHGTVRHRPSRRTAPNVAPEMAQVEDEIDTGVFHGAAGARDVAERATAAEVVEPTPNPVATTENVAPDASAHQGHEPSATTGGAAAPYTTQATGESAHQQTGATTESGHGQGVHSAPASG